MLINGHAHRTRMKMTINPGTTTATTQRGAAPKARPAITPTGNTRNADDVVAPTVGPKNVTGAVLVIALRRKNGLQLNHAAPYRNRRSLPRQSLQLPVLLRLLLPVMDRLLPRARSLPPATANVSIVIVRGAVTDLAPTHDHTLDPGQGHHQRTDPSHTGNAWNSSVICSRTPI